MISGRTGTGGGRSALTGQWRSLGIAVFMAGLAVVLMILPTPAGLSTAGQRVLAVAVMAIGLWCTDAIPAAVTGILLVIALVLSGGVPGFPEALVGFAEPVAYFLIGVLTIGLAVLRSGLAERVARFFLRRCRGSSRALYLQMLLSFPLLTLLLPSATTRTGILVFVYEQALDLGRIPRDAPLAKAIMLALNSINRLASTVLLDGRNHTGPGRLPDRRHFLGPLAGADDRAVRGPARPGRRADLLAVPQGLRCAAGIAAGCRTQALLRQERSERSRSPSGLRCCGSPMHGITGTRPSRRSSPGPVC